ncbi:hypothetical protein [Methylomonas sp. MgM2]
MMTSKWNFISFLVVISEKMMVGFPVLAASEKRQTVYRWLAGLFVITLSPTAYAADPYQTAKNLVTHQGCIHGETVDELLDHKIRPSRRDLGWRVFETDDGYIVERAFLVSKSMEIRYRWHVDAQGTIYAANSRTENLCS